MKRGFIQFIIGIILALAGAGIMFHGSILGDNNTGIAIIIGITGLVLIATSKYRLLK
jgi:membrane-anchored glycerophosphoryl diester phosphodiesterase (GDPDase)